MTFKRPIILSVLLTGMSVAAGPATRPAPPTTPVGPIDRPMVIDPAKPAFIPKFVHADRTPVGSFEERDYVRRFGSPVGLVYGMGGWNSVRWGYAGQWGCGFVGGYGSASVNVSVNYR
ncbi:MAG: hypothetical protein QM754_21035 [Tepidisphaeraceae bacterium]